MIITELSELKNPKFLVIAKSIPSSSNYLSEKVYSKFYGKNKDSDSFVFKGRRDKDDLRGFSTIHYKERANYSPSSISIRDEDLKRIQPNDDIVVIDDAYVAGTFTKLLVKSLSSKNLKNLHIFYYVRLDSELLKQRPYYEHELNRSSISKISDTLDYINLNQLKPTRKLIKLVLMSSEAELQKLYNNLSPEGLDFMKKTLELIDLVDFDGEFLSKYKYIKNNLM